MIARPEHFEYRLEERREREAAIENEPEEMKKFVRENSNYDPFFTSAPEVCFYCGEKITIPAVMWHGCKDRDNIAEIWLHPKCAEEICFKLLRDVAEFQIGKPAADKNLKAWKATRGL